MATTLGWLLGGFLFPGLAQVGAGIGVGVFQWFVLLGRIHRSYRWALATASGWTAGYLLAVAGLPAELEGLTGVVLGLAAGVSQWLVLRGEVRWAGWWIPFSLMGWTTGLLLLPGFLSTPSMAGAITGIALEVLLRNLTPSTVRKDGSTPDRLHRPGSRL